MIRSTSAGRAIAYAAQEYDDFVEAFVSAVQRRWPHILLQWEDFAGTNAARLLERYRDRLCTFNDDIQGTAAVTTATLLAAVDATGSSSVAANHCDVGSGSAGIGIVELLIAAMKRAGPERRAGPRPHLRIQSLRICSSKAREAYRQASCRSFDKRASISTAGSSAATKTCPCWTSFATPRSRFSPASPRSPAHSRRDRARDGAAIRRRPVIFPLSNPTSQSEATPADLLRWTEGRALVGTGSPFAPVEVDGRMVRISQINNSYIFPGLALGILVSRATRVTDDMIMSAAKTLASLSPTYQDKNAPLLPPIGTRAKLRLVVAEAVARQAIAEGVAAIDNPATLARQIRAYVWEPVYVPYRAHEREDAQPTRSLVLPVTGEAPASPFIDRMVCPAKTFYQRGSYESFSAPCRSVQLRRWCFCSLFRLRFPAWRSGARLHPTGPVDEYKPFARRARRPGAQGNDPRRKGRSAAWRRHAHRRCRHA